MFPLFVTIQNTNHGLPLDFISSITCSIGSGMDLLHLFLQHWLRARNCCNRHSHSNYFHRYTHTAHNDILRHAIHLRNTARHISVLARKEIGNIQEDSLPAKHNTAQTTAGNVRDMDFVRTALHWPDKPMHILSAQS